MVMCSLSLIGGVTSIRSSVHPDGRSLTSHSSDPACCCQWDLDQFPCRQFEPAHWPQLLVTSPWRWALDATLLQVTIACAPHLSEGAAKNWTQMSDSCGCRPGSFEKNQPVSPSCPPALPWYCQEFAFAKRDRPHFQLYQLELKFLHYEFLT